MRSFHRDFIDIGVGPQVLEREWQRAKEGVDEENCIRKYCTWSCEFKGGVAGGIAQWVAGVDACAAC